jgi:ABC-2 type transport system ATP-binding protein
LCKTYEKFELKNVSFDLQEGHIMGYIGRNGAGKTTTFKSMVNLVHPDSGVVQFFGRDFKDSEFEVKQAIGFVTGGVDYYPKKKLKTITSVTRRFYPSWDEAAYGRYLKLFSLDQEKTIDALSAGMKVKYSIALALSHRAKLLILDEPTSGLDPVSRDDLLSVFIDLVERDGVSILFSTHITTDLEKCADDITYLKEGHVLDSATLPEFLDKWRLVKGPAGSVPTGLIERLVGYKAQRGTFSALAGKADADGFAGLAGAGVSATQADLESIMVHIERDAANGEEASI